MKNTFIKISRREIGECRPVYIIAEAGVNHNGRLDMALHLVEKAKEAGADAVKFQTFKTEKITTMHAASAKYQDEKTGRQFDMLKRLELSYNDFRKLSAFCKKKNIEFLSSAFDEGSMDFLIELGVKALKIGSGEITNLPLIMHAAKSGLPIILSTGMSDLFEIRYAVNIFKVARNPKLCLLHCVSQYPAPMDSLNLKAIVTLKKKFKVPTGFSDHSVGYTAAVAATALGASVIEKHFTLDKAMEGPDHKASSSPDELKEYITAVRETEKALGSGEKKIAGAEMNVKDLVRKSIVAATAIPKGALIIPEMLTTKRPGTGIQPCEIPKLIGAAAKQDIAADDIIEWRMIQK
ncbi:MAG: N-acetylneuraminate synthase [Planctomycetes bacterium]|nr:N-acetylneuraminate synthase [Planctomycetota bacterium]